MLLMTVIVDRRSARDERGEARQPTATPRAPQPSEAVVIRFKTNETMDGVYRAEAENPGAERAAPRTVNAPAKGRDVRLRIPAAARRVVRGALQGDRVLQADRPLPAQDQLRRQRRAPCRLDPLHGGVLITYSMSVSADGYVNRPDGTFDWAAPTEELHRFHNQRMVETDVQLIGRNLYEIMLVWETEEFSEPAMAEFAELWRPLERVVFSNTLTSVEGSGRLATRSLEEEIAALGDRTDRRRRRRAGGGVHAARPDRRFPAVRRPDRARRRHAVLPPDVHVDLDLVETRTFGSTVHLRYRRV